MGRPLKGSIRRRGGHFLASVPVRRGATERREVQFATKTDAQAWLERQVERLDRGLDAEAAPRDETNANPVAASVEATSAGSRRSTDIDDTVHRVAPRVVRVARQG
jgi:hypothetical protein